jgi:hypothetical protein
MFLSELSSFNKKNLKHTETVVTTQAGTRHVENAATGETTQHGTGTGFIVSTEARAEEEKGLEEPGLVVEIDYHTHLHAPTQAELEHRLQWHAHRTRLGDG